MNQTTIAFDEVMELRKMVRRTDEASESGVWSVTSDQYAQVIEEVIALFEPAFGLKAVEIAFHNHLRSNRSV